MSLIIFNIGNLDITVWSVLGVTVRIGVSGGEAADNGSTDGQKPGLLAWAAQVTAAPAFELVSDRSRSRSDAGETRSQSAVRGPARSLTSDGERDNTGGHSTKNIRSAGRG